MSKPAAADTRDLKAAAERGTLLGVLSAYRFEDVKPIITDLARLHDAGEVDAVGPFRPPFEDLERFDFFQVQHLFCELLVQLDGPIQQLAEVCKTMVNHAGNDLAAGRPYQAFQAWCEKEPGRPRTVLEMIEADPTHDFGVTFSALVAGGRIEPDQFTNAALRLSKREEHHLRMAGLAALGRIYPQSDTLRDALAEALLQAAAIDQHDQSRSVAVGAAHQQASSNTSASPKMERILLEACKQTGPLTRHALANIIDASDWLSAVGRERIISVTGTADRDALGTVQVLDLALIGWDLNADREGAFNLVSALLRAGEKAIEVEELDSFIHHLQGIGGGHLGWFVVKLLSSQSRELHHAADGLLHMETDPKHVLCDLTALRLTDDWIEYLARKALGYLTIKPKAAAALIASCLMAAGQSARGEVAELTFKYLLLNFPGALQTIKELTADSIETQPIVMQLEERLEDYLNGLRSVSSVADFAPNQSQRRVQAERQAEFWREVQKQARDKSVLLKHVHTANLLYGSGSINYIHEEAGAPPRRRAVPLGSHEHVMEFPRLEAIDPIGWHFAIMRFRSEEPPA